MEVINQRHSPPLRLYQQTAVETVWSTLNSREQEHVLRTLVLVCDQIASTTQTSHQRLTQPDPITNNQEVGDE